MAKIFINVENEPLLPSDIGNVLKKRLFEAGGLTLIISAAGLLMTLISFNPNDPSLNNVTDQAAHNFMGIYGAYIADLLLQSLGLAGLLPVFALTAWGVRLFRKQPIPLIWFRLIMLLSAIILLAMGLSSLSNPQFWPLISTLGGVTGSVLIDRVIAMAAAIGVSNSNIIYTFLSTLSIIALCAALGFSFKEWRTGSLMAWSNINTFSHYVAQRIIITSSQVKADFQENITEEPSLKPISRNRLMASEPQNTKIKKKLHSTLQGKLDLRSSNEYQLPPLNLLELPINNTNASAITHDALQQNALLLEKVLEDFGVHGEITKVHPGPVVTLYELEPAPGTKTSRIISLSDDIARSMSAVSVRVAVVPGRNAIGIELPNVSRELVYLRDLLSADELDRNHGKLKLALGKDISGTTVLVDLGRMPHLLIAGTTGSGKSVAINTMILSLLYQLRPEECKLIMIDPKMLELSVYDDIPHLLTPVVTDPSKAIVALKWAVREMEERYRAMSQLGVRNITSYNERLCEAKKKDEVLTRRVQTGFDEQGKPIFEEQSLSMEALPFIVIVVDEMADLMMVAGKDIEITVQRLAQMARAAGIHVIMATQRPSVDVITGTIKANFPTRVSFQVTSKIDSRTILGEQGAEQLLGQGDMLYMAGGGRIMRVHGPFVSDLEVENVVKHLKSQGKPTYIQAITEDENESLALSEDGQAIDALYDEAVNLIAQEGKASTSFIQRRLQIGYNRAARIIERMEAENIVSKANRVGRREVLIPQGGNYDS